MDRQFWYGFLIGVFVMLCVQAYLNLTKMRREYKREKLLSDARQAAVQAKHG